MISATRTLPFQTRTPRDLELAVAGRTRPVWVLGVKTDTFARVAWERGRDVALALERRVCENLIHAARGKMRGGDMFVHAYASDLFGFALLERSRADAIRGGELNSEQRRTLASIERAVRDEAGVEIHAGWTLLGPGDDAARNLTSAAERGRDFVRRREFATLLHDLTTPVASIYGSLTAATDGILPPDVTRRFLVNARSESARVGRLIRGFLAAQDDDVSACDALEAVERAALSLEPLALARDVSVEVCARAEHVMSAISEDKLTAIVISLLENAIKHGRRGGSVRAHAFSDGASLCVRVDDDGPGIPEESRERIFQFGSRASDAEGSGIGLAHARLLVVAAGGEISAARSDLGGARFTIRLPSLDAR